MQNIVVLLAPGFEETEAIFPVDLMRRAGLFVTFAGVEKTSVVGSHGIKVEADIALKDLSTDPIAVVLPGGMPGAKNLSESPLVQSLLKQAFAQGWWVAAICAAPTVVLGRLGYLRGKSFTGFPEFVEEGQTLGGHFVDQDVVLDGKLITSRGVGTAHLFGLELVRRLGSSTLSDDVAERSLLSLKGSR